MSWFPPWLVCVWFEVVNIQEETRGREVREGLEEEEEGLEKEEDEKRIERLDEPKMLGSGEYYFLFSQDHCCIHWAPFIFGIELILMFGSQRERRQDVHFPGFSPILLCLGCGCPPGTIKAVR